MATATAPARSTAGAPTRARRAEVPTVLQMEVTECGAASLGMVLAHFGRWVPLQELRTTCGASRDGTSAGDLLRAAQHYGLEGKGSYRTARTLAKGSTFPLILFWKNAHFVVLEYLDERYAWLNDPAVGRRRVTFDEFERDYSKICLTLTPGAAFRPGGTPPTTWKRVLQRVRPVAPQVLAVVVLGLLATVPGLAVAAISKLFVSDVLIAADRSVGWKLVGALAIVLALQGVIGWYQNQVLIRVSIALTIGESARFVHRAFRLPESYFVARSVGDLSQRVQHNREVASLLTGRLAMVGVGVVVTVVYAVAMIVVDAPLALVVLVLTVANLAALRVALTRSEQGSRLLVERQARLQQTTAFGAITLEDLKASGLESDFYARWEGLAVAVGDIRQDMAVRSQVGQAVPALLTALTSAAVLGLGALQVIDGTLAVGSLVAFQTLARSFAAPLSDFVGFAWMIQRIQHLTRRLDDVLDEPVAPRGTGPAVGGDGDGDAPDGAATELQGAIRLEGVTFGFKTTAAPLIAGLGLDIPPGARVAVVGTSGSGKSTLVRLVAGLYEPWEGRVLLDGRPRLDHPNSVLTRSVGMVDQRIALFSGTVRDNLTLWDDTLDDHDVVRAARDAQIHDDIVARAGGYDAPVADGGANWSGGQRQRLVIARALVRNPSILLLDEATSALDTASELAVEAALRRRGCTAVVVAHRLSTVRDADLIIVMDRGRIVEAGRHEELLALDGTYAGLVRE